jgi:hypothetical protein
MNAVSQWWIGGLRTRKAKVAGSIPASAFNRLAELQKQVVSAISADGIPSADTKVAALSQFPLRQTRE